VQAHLPAGARVELSVVPRADADAPASQEE
jgi:hypothetical protein